MKFSDTVWGAVVLAFSIVLFVYVQGFPNIPGQKVGPAALPGALAVGLAICGAILFLRGLRARLAGRGVPWMQWPEWFGSRPQVIGFVVLVAVNVFYLLAVDRLGFVLTGSVYLAALMLVLRVRPVLALPLALALTLAIHYCFYKLLKVPLPWGVLQSIAW